ncbi:hypothetical protein V2A60_010318 [Cordyceps javanica]|uniref:Threonine dehydratase catabolic n=1 Tax=Cordyceps javanica TaxID=43265 RepID=A0A545VUI5_9HYPO|nr:threonine dehydratase catabolic [Cordyceps javanica]TQW05391.1 threonine dehydratase catabolic [Cordyceps javanica]
MAAESRSIPIQVSVVLPAASMPSKIAGAEQNGARVFLAGETPKDRERVTREILDETGAVLVGPMDDPRIVLGQATTTFEFVEQVATTYGEKLDALVLPSATGGLLSGAAVVCEQTDTMVFGCEPYEGGPDLRGSIEAGIVSDPGAQNTIADGLRASTSANNFDVIRQKDLVDGIFAADDEEIRQAWWLLIEQLRLLVEPTAALSLATVLCNKELRAMLASRKPHWNIGLILTGGNTTISRIVEEFSRTASQAS